MCSTSKFTHHLIFYVYAGGRKCSYSGGTVLVSKTTYKLRPILHNSDLDSAGEETYDRTNGNLGKY